MNRFLLSAAALALMAAPAFAQHGDHDHDGGGEHGGGEHGQPHAPGPQAMPHAAPQVARPVAPQNNARDFGRHDDHRGGFGNNHPDNHVGNHLGNRSGNPPTPHFDNNRGARPGFNPGGNAGFGGHRDYRSFNGYHRSFNAPQRFRGPSYRRPSGWYSHRWSFGEILPSLFWSSGYWLNDYQAYDLPPPPYGAVWVRNGDDALLIDRDSGEVISVEYGVFY